MYYEPEPDIRSGDVLRQMRDARWPGPVIAWVLRVLAVVAVAGAAYLAVAAWQHGPIRTGCGNLPQLDCDQVLNSRWSRWLWIPVAYPALGVYLLVALASFLMGPKTPGPWRRAARFTLVMLATLAAVAAIWFLSLLVFAVGKVCLSCVVVHICGLTIGFLVLVHPPIHRERYSLEWMGAIRKSFGMPVGRGVKHPDYALKARAVIRAIGLGLAVASLFIIVQIAIPPRTHRINRLPRVALRQPTLPSRQPQKPATTIAPARPGEQPRPRVESPIKPPASPAVEPDSVPPEAPHRSSPATSKRGGPRWIPLLDNEARLDAYAHPVFGDPEAKHIVVELFDYTCKHCRTQSRQMEKVRESFGRQLAVVLLLVPMSPLCNRHVQTAKEEHQNACRYAKLALAVWRLAPDKFPEFHHWLTEDAEVPPLPESMDQATRLLGDEAWKSELDSSVIHQQIEYNTDLFLRCGAGEIPKLLAGKYVVTGETTSDGHLREILERITGVQTPAP